MARDGGLRDFERLRALACRFVADRHLVRGYSPHDCEDGNDQDGENKSIHGYSSALSLTDRSTCATATSDGREAVGDVCCGWCVSARAS